MIDLEKRRKIMQRSIKLGHCICNPKQSCPCDIFKEKDICPCAGERPEQAVEEVNLTSLVEKAGCASKINQNDLKKVLAGLPEVNDPRVLVGTNTCDDAGVYLLGDNLALVQTVDVFTPSADDPYTFGQIAAANSLSDVYAMGGQPLTALSVIAFPIETLSHRVMTQMLRGGMEKMREAGVAVIGGHSINDVNPKFGYAVTGEIDPSRIVTNDKAAPGDALVLTKPLGVGVINFANQLGRASDTALAAAARSMTELNKTSAQVMLDVGVNAATDVTGFGLFGHLKEMATQSHVTAEINADCIPIFDEVLDYISQGMISGGTERNREHASDCVTAAEDVSEELQNVFYDPQTSGGLLMSVPQEKADELVARLHDQGVVHAAIIGRITSKSDGRIVLKMSGGEGPRIVARVKEVETACCSPSAHADCCSPGSEAVTGNGTGKAEEMFGAFMQQVNSEGDVPVKTKELIAIALSLVSKCEPCVKIHINKARSLGITQSEIDEAVWMAVSFGGAPTLMFYNSIMEKS